MDSFDSDKAEIITKLIKEKNIDIVTLVETQKPKVNLINQLKNNGLDVKHTPRVDRKGGVLTVLNIENPRVQCKLTHENFRHQCNKTTAKINNKFIFIITTYCPQIAARNILNLDSEILEFEDY